MQRHVRATSPSGPNCQKHRENAVYRATGYETDLLQTQAQFVWYVNDIGCVTLLMLGLAVNCAEAAGAPSDHRPLNQASSLLLLW